MTKRILATVLLLALCLSLLPASAYAGEDGGAVKHTVTVVYEMPEGCATPAPAPYSFTGETGEAYVVSSPSVEGFAPDKDMVYGTVGEKDETITVRYSPIVYVVYVEYKVPEGYTAPKSQHKTGSPGTKYSFTTPAVSGLTPDKELVQGEIGAKDETITVTYYADVWTVLVKYAVPQGFTAPADGRATGVPGMRYSIESPSVAGLVPDKAKVEGSIGNADAVVNVAYALEDHSVTVEYEVPDGYQAPDPVTVTDKIGTAFRVESPKIDGLAPSMTAVNGTIDFEDHTVTVRYSDEQYTVVVQYEVPTGYEDKLPKQRSKTGLPTEEYSFPSPVIAGLTPDQAVVSGHIGNLNRTIRVTYTESTYDVTVTYSVPDGDTAPPKAAWSGLRPGDTYSAVSPDLSANGLTLKNPRQELVSGTVGEEDVSVTVEYEEMEHFIAVYYEVPEGFIAPGSQIVWGLRGTEYNIFSPSVTGLKPDQTVISGTFGRESQTFTVTYTMSLEDDLCPNAGHNDLGGHHDLVAGWAPDDHTIHRLEFGDGWETVSYTNNAVYCIDCGKEILRYRCYSSGREHYCSFPHGGDTEYATDLGDFHISEACETCGCRWTRDHSWSLITATSSGAAYDGSTYEPGDTIKVCMTNGCGHVRSVYARAANPHTVTVNYVVPAGYTAPESASKTASAGTEYRFPTPEISGLKPDRTEVAGTIGETDETITVTYSARDVYHTLTVNFLVPEGFEAPASRSWKLKSGDPYAFIAPRIDRLKTDNTNPIGFMGDADQTVNVQYYEAHRLIIRYVFPEGYAKAQNETVSYWYKPGENFNIESPAYEYLDCFPHAVTGTMYDEDVEVMVTYNYNQTMALTRWLTVNYSVPEGYTAPAQYRAQVEVGAEYSVVPPAVQGLTPSLNAVTGRMGEADTVVNVSYSVSAHRLTINYNAPAGETKPASYSAYIKIGDQYVVRSPRITGYTASPFAVAGTMGNEDVTVEVGYTANPVAVDPYTLTVSYTVPEAFQAVKPATVTAHYSQGESYIIHSPAIEGLVPSLEAVRGIMPGQDLSVEVVYRPADNAYYYVTIHYEVPQGYTKPQDVVMTGVPGTPFCFESPEISELAPDQEKVEGTIANQDQEFTVTYQRVYLVWITYKVPEGFVAPAAVFYRAPTGYQYRHVSPYVEGLMLSFPLSETVIEGTIGTKDVFAEVRYMPGVALKIIYLYDGIHSTTKGDGKIQMPEPYVQTYPYGAEFDYYVHSPEIEGLWTDEPTVQGEINGQDVTELVNYYDQSHEVKFVVNGPEDAWQDNGVVEDRISVIEGEPFEYTTSERDGLRPVQEKITGVMGKEDMEVLVDYEGIYHTLTINCVYPEGYTGPEKVEHQVLEKHSFRKDPPAVEGLMTRPEEVEGEMGTEDMSVTVEYAPAYYTLSVSYKYPDIWTHETSDDYTELLAPGEEYHITPPAAAHATVTPASADGVMGDADAKVSFVYSWIPFKLTANYVFPADYTGPRPTPIVQEYQPLDRYQVEAPVVAGLYPEPASYSGLMPIAEDLEVTFTYHASDPVPVTEGDGQTVNKASDGARFRMTKEHDSFSGKVWGDGKPLQRGTDYTDRSGSTIIELTESYLSTLLPGSHELAVRFEDSDAVMSFTTTYNPFGPATFTLPAAIRTIEEGAFEGNPAMSVVYVPDTCTRIDANVFKDCTGLKQIRLPKDCAIDDSAFTGCTGLIAIYAPAGGTTETWANGNGIPFIAE